MNRKNTQTQDTGAAEGAAGKTNEVKANAAAITDSAECTGKEELPYERFLRFGADTLTEAELLAIIIRTGTKGKSALDTAREVLRLARYPREGLLGLQELTVEELEGIGGIGPVKAVKLKCLAELCRRMSRARISAGKNFTGPEQVAEYFMEEMRHRDTECVILVCLDSKGQMLCEKKVSEGSVNMSLISPREIFLAALEHKAVNILLVHNHPSGDPAPSEADKLLTCNIKDMGDRMGIALLDHVIIGDNCHVSFRENAWFSNKAV